MPGRWSIAINGIYLPTVLFIVLRLRIVFSCVSGIWVEVCVMQVSSHQRDNFVQRQAIVSLDCRIGLCKVKYVIVSYFLQ